MFSRYAARGSGSIIGMIVVAVVAFTLGALLFGGGPDPSHVDHTTGSSAEPTMWTCSMHPQIKLPAAGQCPLCFMDLIPLDTGSGDDTSLRQLRLSDTARQLARIETTPATRAFAKAAIRMAGRVTYDETNVATITAWVPGRLDRLYVDFTGITVAKGDPLVYVYSPELLAAQEELFQAHKAVESLNKTTSRVLRKTTEATLEAVRDKLRLFGLTGEQIESIETTGQVSDHLTIYAPTGGVVVHKDAKEGMYVSTGTRIYTIADLSTLWVMFEAYESDLPWLSLNQRVEFTSPSFPGDTFLAAIDFIDPVVDPQRRTVRVRAVVDNTDKKLKPDMFVRGVVMSWIDGEGNVIDEGLAGKAGAIDNAPILIPASAPLITGRRAVVYVEIPDDDGPLFEGREIELGPRAGDFYVVTSGIAEGDLVVTNGAFKIDSELQIQARPSMMSPGGGGGTADHEHHAPANGGRSHNE
jgi:Cu(I)/Ag(I) efflux system membrane fusion protein